MRIRQITAAGAAATALMLGAALPAFAADAQPTARPAAAEAPALKAKPKQKVHVWEDAKYKGKDKYFTKNAPHLGGWNDTISSAKNLGKRTVSFYITAKYQGAHIALAEGQSEAHFGNRGVGDIVSSIKFS
ncbi:peptidase inhibitor family I36 protein [Streptomyces chrestomyceticus]|uniref:peptidase inhibitor family I36 protein n=1 Tax=Streptomyces chrestomyceticus TaxID=68185 RepID=UPI0033D437AF